MNSRLKITRMTDEKESTDGRNYRTVYFQKVPEGNVLSNARERGRNIWEKGPNGSAGDPIYPHLKEGAQVVGDIQTVDVEDYYIPNEYGKYNDPDTGMPANKVSTYSSVVFEDENIASLARSQGHKLLGEAEAEALEQNQTVDEELAVAE